MLGHAAKKGMQRASVRCGRVSNRPEQRKKARFCGGLEFFFRGYFRATMESPTR
jgi:hypothetical protein